MDELEAAREEARLLRGVLQVVKEDLHVKNEVCVAEVPVSLPSVHGMLFMSLFMSCFPCAAT